MVREVKNILVTGGAGFIGSAFIRYLLLSDFNGRVVNYDLLTYASNLKNLQGVTDHPRYSFVLGDICDSSLLKATLEKYEVDTIVHFAAETHVDNSIIDPFLFLKTNVIGTFTILEILKEKKNVHFHHISTDEVYGSILEGYFHEKMRYDPSSPYSASKAASDHYVLAYHKTFGLSVTLSHSTNNYGPGQHVEKLIPLMIKNCLEKRPLPVYGDGKNIRDWLYVEDHAEAIFKIIKFGRSGETYDIGGGEEKRNIDVIRAVISKVEKLKKEDLSHLITFVKDRPGHDFRYAIDSSKIRNALQFSPKHTFEKGLEKTILWYLQESKINF